MFQRIATGWELTKQSFRVLRSDKELVLFPILSSIACLLVLASFGVPLMFTPWFKELLHKQEVTLDPLAYVLLFAFYFVNYFVIVFFNSALVSCALQRMNGGHPTLGYGLQQAAARLPQIAAWALVSATVGILLKAIESKSEKIGQLVASLVGAGWTIATYFVVPIIVMERANPIEALKRSTSLIRHTWGEALTGNLGTNAIILIGMLPGFAIMMLSFVIAAATNQPAVTAIGVGLAVIWMVGISLVSATVQTILLAALYQFASHGEVPPQFDAALLRRAFGSQGA